MQPKTPDFFSKPLNYLATNPNAPIQYHAIGTIIYVHSDASDLSITKEQSRVVGVHFFSDSKPESKDYKTFVSIMNGIIHVVYKTL